MRESKKKKINDVILGKHLYIFPSKYIYFRSFKQRK